MKKEKKVVVIESLAAQLEQTPNFYLADISGINAEVTAKLRRECFDNSIKMVVVKNTLMQRAIEQVCGQEAKELFPTLVGSTAVMFTESVNAPAKLIKSFGGQYGKPVLKGAYVQECAYVGEDQLETLIHIKSREELIGDIVGLILSPAQRLVSAIKQSGATIAGAVKTLAEREE